MFTCHTQTNHSYLSVRSRHRYIDWDAQPARYKHYPAFMRRYPLAPDMFIALCGQTTLQRTYGGSTYTLRTVPSAGALYPCELYVQIRSKEGFIDGLYHYAPDKGELVLLKELYDEGLEAYLPDTRKVDGYLFLVTAAYFRSVWKYGSRAIRYLFLDGGHLLGAIEAALFVRNKRMEILFEADKVALMHACGFWDQELPLALVANGRRLDAKATAFEKPLPFVCATDYFEPNRFVYDAYLATLEPLSPASGFALSSWQADKEVMRTAILQRRSIRQFAKKAITSHAYQTLLAFARSVISVDRIEKLRLFAALHRVEGVVSGLYCDGVMVKAGEWSQQCGYLGLEQKLAEEGAVTFFIVSEATNYQVAGMLAGLIGHRIYLVATMLGLGCSGIGAYYDEETRAFLGCGTSEMVLYMLAVGH